jgi:hypothetical protein
VIKTRWDIIDEAHKFVASCSYLLDNDKTNVAVDVGATNVVVGVEDNNETQFTD